MAIISGKLCEGRGVGRKMGFPTLNMLYEGKARGVFAAKVLLEGSEDKGKWFKAAVHIGDRPTFDDPTVICEAFVLDWDGKLSNGTEMKEGAEIKIETLTRIREIKKFENLEDLKEQIEKDVEFVKRL